ncbi:MAG: hypothetical protein HY596_01320 [Candidatus Omnitrophica bacterium]|nr:hypothetical protein [Candidatus Omnitrophota bacterium]
MDWNVTVVQPIQSFVNQLMAFLPNVIGALVLLLVGWLIAKAIEGVVVKLLKTAQADKLAQQLQLADVLSKGGIRRTFSELIGALIYWIVMLMVLIAALNALQLTVAAQLLERVATFLPNVIAALFIIVVGVLAATFLSSTVRTAASNSGIGQANLLGQLVHTIVVVFACVAALQQLRIQFVGEVFLIILAAVSFGLALAFGLGCKDLAGRWVGDVINQLSSRRR